MTWRLCCVFAASANTSNAWFLSRIGLLDHYSLRFDKNSEREDEKEQLKIGVAARARATPQKADSLSLSCPAWLQHIDLHASYLSTDCLSNQMFLC